MIAYLMGARVLEQKYKNLTKQVKRTTESAWNSDPPSLSKAR